MKILKRIGLFAIFIFIPFMLVACSGNKKTYTAKFIADEVVIDSITFKTTDSEIKNEPQVPNKIGYIGIWEDYTISNQDIIVNATYTPIDYTATFVANEITIYTTTFTIEDIKIKDEPDVPIKSGYSGRWENYSIEAENITINAIYTLKDYDEDGFKVIATSEDLINYASDFENFKINARLYSNIDLGGIEWSPIGNDKNNYSAIFDGNGFTISNYKITTCDTENIEQSGYAGFFGFANNSQILNLNLINYKIYIINENSGTNDSYDVGGLVGFAVNSLIENCTTIADISIIGNLVEVGGLIGCSYNNVEINNCQSSGHINGYSFNYGSYIGGLIGTIYNSSNINFCNSSANIDSTSNNYRSFAGGLIGNIDNNATILSCSSSGNVSSISIFNNAYSGGLIGYIEKSEIKNSFSNSTISSKGNLFTYSGGLVGLVKSTKISNCYSTGDSKSLSSYEPVSGGLIGGILDYETDSSIINCYETGNSVSNIISDSCENAYAGGLIGYAYGINLIKIENCYSLGNVLIFSSETNSAKKYIGGLIGFITNFSILNCHRINTQTISIINNISGTTNKIICEEGLFSDITTILTFSYNNWNDSIWNLFLDKLPTLK